MRHKALIMFAAAMVLALLIPLLATTPSEAAGSNPCNTISYVVQPGDRLASIARKFCTDWPTIYALNRDIIGPNPDHVGPGTVLKIPAVCAPSWGWHGIYDRGWLPHARGNMTPPNHYRVERGDTWFSIGRRFGVSVMALRQANGQQYPKAHTWVVIPGLAVAPALPIAPTPTPAPIMPAHASISAPPVNALLPENFQVQGQGEHLPGNQVIVRIKGISGAVLAEQSALLQGAGWSVSFHINQSTDTEGVIEVLGQGTGVLDSRKIFFQQHSDKIYAPDHCHIHVRSQEAGFIEPEGAILGIFPAGALLEAQQRKHVNTMDWYQSSVTIDGTVTPVWLPSTSLDALDNGC